MINKYNKGSDKKDLDGYFNLAKNEKVLFTQDNARTLLTKYGRTAPAGFLANLGFRTAATLRYYAIGTIALTGIALITYYSLNKQEIKTNQSESIKPAVSSILVNNIEKDQKPVLSSEKREVLNVKHRNINSVQSRNDFNPVEAKYEEILPVEVHAFQALTSASLADNQLPFGFSENTSLYSEIIVKDEQEPEDNDELKTIAFDYAIHHGISASASMRMTNIAGSTASLIGGRASWIMNNQVTVGITGMGYLGINKFNYLHSNGEKFSGNMNLGYGGLFIEYTFRPDDKIHYSINSSAGFGGFKLVSPMGVTQNISYPWGTFYYVEPGANIEYSYSKHLRFGVEASYRHSGVFQKSADYKQDNNFNNIQLGSISGGFFIKFGIF